MRKIILLLVIACFGLIAEAQYFQATVRVELNGTGPEAVFYITPNATGSNITDGWTGVEFFITYPPAYSLTFGSVSVNTSNFPGLSITKGGENTMGSATSGNNTYWFYYSGTATTSYTYTAGVEYEVFRVSITNSTVDFGDLSLEYDGTGYTTYLVLTGSIGTGYTVVDQNVNAPVYFGSGTYSGANGDAVLGGGTCQYTIFDQPLIPMVLFANTLWQGGLGAGNSPGNGDGAKKCYIKDLNAQLPEAEANVLDLIIETGTNLTIMPNAGLTASGPTSIAGAAGLVIASNPTGTGSFIDNGTITYGGSGSAKVQTYLANSATAPNFHFHLVGPTVDITGTGVELSAFNVANGNTYAYRYNEPTDSWLNYYNLTDPVPTAKGIGLSTNDGIPYTMEMTGNLKTGNISSEAMTIGLNGNYLLSNPYPSSIYWNDLYSNNSAIVSDKVYIYDATFSGGNYRAYNQGSGGTDDFTGYIQVGQGFFVEATSASPFSFDNGDRHHSNEPFYKSGTYSNRLDVRVTGNESRDGLLVHFYQGARLGYEPNEDVEKMMSFSPTATQFWTVLENNQKMSINALPLELLGQGMQSIPMSFICSADGDYLMEFYDVASFDLGTEIWLEDKLTGGDWISINNQPEYIFNGSPEDANDRFVLHFFGPTGTEELAGPTIDLYSFGQYAYVRNNTEEAIKEIRIYSLSGALMNQVHTPDQKFLKLWVDDRMAYYVITVITDQQVYTKKLFISK